jgi:hypothetical protein
LALDAIKNGARNRLVVTWNAAVGDLILSAGNGAGENDFSSAIERMEAETETKTGGGLDGLVELLVIHGCSVLLEVSEKFAYL